MDSQINNLTTTMRGMGEGVGEKEEEAKEVVAEGNNNREEEEEIEGAKEKRVWMAISIE